MQEERAEEGVGRVVAKGLGLGNGEPKQQVDGRPPRFREPQQMFEGPHDFPADTRRLGAQMLDVLVCEDGGQVPHRELRHGVCE